MEQPGSQEVRNQAFCIKNSLENRPGSSMAGRKPEIIILYKKSIRELPGSNLAARMPERSNSVKKFTRRDTTAHRAGKKLDNSKNVHFT